MAQIELMMSDLPHTLYKKTDSRGKGRPTQQDVDEATRLMQEAYRKRLKAREDENAATVSEIFGGALENES